LYIIYPILLPRGNLLAYHCGCHPQLAFLQLFIYSIAVIFMPWFSKRSVFTNKLSNAVMSQGIFTDAYHLINDCSSNYSSDDVVDSRSVAVVHYSALSSSHYLYKDSHYHPDFMGAKAGFWITRVEKNSVGL